MGYEWIQKTILKKSEQKNKKKNRTYPADCRKIAAVDSNKHD